MSAYPSLPLFTDAFIADTGHLSAAETGAYLMLLMVAWRSPGCSLPVLATQAVGEGGRTLAKGLYLSVLARYPAWAIEQACNRFAQGFAGDRKFMPSPGDLAHEVRRLIEPQVAERARLSRVLDAEVIPDPDPTMAEKARKAAADLAARLAMPGEERPTPEAEAEAATNHLEQLKAQGLGGLKLSEATVAKMLGRPAQHAEPA
ncbi:DUF1376 domain-containing protein [Methylobacterium nodulans]|uniref:DUF1376 domain-containing protein n=1 Tax=Methylobacterium nodulans (strain LMG 21967 / CNCM I-2342 / ORS 2060) TaxID=460265 RepID=B8IXG4_METNO|nr:DUF1376 domain-containing protein [Methylobacterium nodulans]ACL63205.1 protein of unknown function DUF1376 [Methylobacterium nodulans ORS 2060]